MPGKVVHRVEQDLFEERPQPTCAGTTQQGEVGDRLQTVGGELQLDILELEDLLVLADEGVLRFGEDANEGSASRLRTAPTSAYGR